LKLAELHRAHLAWVAIQVMPERQIEEQGERFSIPDARIRPGDQTKGFFDAGNAARVRESEGSRTEGG
jgi:hypothetical protein